MTQASKYFFATLFYSCVLNTLYNILYFDVSGMRRIKVKIYGFISGKKLAIFDSVLGVSLPLEFKLFLRILNCSANESKTLSLTDQSLKRRLFELSPWRVRVEMQMLR